MLEEGQQTDVAGCFLDELQSGTVVKVIKRSSGGAQATEAQKVYNMCSRVQIAYVSDGQAKTGWISARLTSGPQDLASFPPRAPAQAKSRRRTSCG